MWRLVLQKCPITDRANQSVPDTVFCARAPMAVWNDSTNAHRHSKTSQGPDRGAAPGVPRAAELGLKNLPDINTAIPSLL